jgi:hypothetical protein
MNLHMLLLMPCCGACVCVCVCVCVCMCVIIKTVTVIVSDWAGYEVVFSLKLLIIILSYVVNIVSGHTVYPLYHRMSLKDVLCVTEMSFCHDLRNANNSKTKNQIWMKFVLFCSPPPGLSQNILNFKVKFKIKFEFKFKSTKMQTTRTRMVRFGRSHC